MTPVTTRATYKEKEGVIIPDTKPDFELADVIVTYVPKSKTTAYSPHIAPAKIQDHGEIIKALKRTFGAWGPGESGIEYEDRIRKEAEQHVKDAWGDT